MCEHERVDQCVQSSGIGPINERFMHCRDRLCPNAQLRCPACYPPLPGW